MAHELWPKTPQAYVFLISDQYWPGELHYTAHKLIKAASGYIERELASPRWLHFDTSNSYFQYTMNAIAPAWSLFSAVLLWKEYELLVKVFIVHLEMSFMYAIILASANIEQYAASTSYWKLGQCLKVLFRDCLHHDRPGCLLRMQNPTWMAWLSW